MAKKYINLSDRTERLLDSLKCRTEAETADEVIRKAVMVYNLVGTGLEQGHKVLIGNEPISLMEFHVIVPEATPALNAANGRIRKDDDEETIGDMHAGLPHRD